jgi:amino acid transporter
MLMGPKQHFSFKQKMIIIAIAFSIIFSAAIGYRGYKAYKEFRQEIDVMKIVLLYIATQVSLE